MTFVGKNLTISIVGVVLMLMLALVCRLKITYIILIVCVLVGVVTKDCLGYTKSFVLPKYRLKRLASFRNPAASALGDGYQLYRSQLALGAGGAIGRGYSNSVLKHKYIPEKHTDFIVAVIGEEFGFLGTCGVILCFLSFGYIGFSISAHAMDYEGGYLAAGLTVSVLLHAFVNLSVVSGLGPTTGLTAPFLSYGGSSILANFVGLGLLFSVIRTSLKGRKERSALNYHNHKTAI